MEPHIKLFILYKYKDFIFYKKTLMILLYIKNKYIFIK